MKEKYYRADDLAQRRQATIEQLEASVTIKDYNLK